MPACASCWSAYFAAAAGGGIYTSSIRRRESYSRRLPCPTCHRRCCRCMRLSSSLRLLRLRLRAALHRVHHPALHRHGHEHGQKAGHAQAIHGQARRDKRWWRLQRLRGMPDQARGIVVPVHSGDCVCTPQVGASGPPLVINACLSYAAQVAPALQPHARTGGRRLRRAAGSWQLAVRCACAVWGHHRWHHSLTAATAPKFMLPPM